MRLLCTCNLVSPIRSNVCSHQLINEMTTELNKFTLNNEIVLMRHDVRKARVCLAHKITRTIQSLRKGKGSKEPTEKDLLKADKLVEEIRTLKKLKVDNITKTLLVYVDDPGKVLSDIRKSFEDRVIAKMFTVKSMETSIAKFRRKYPNWLEDVPALLKTMKKKSKTKIKEIPQNSTKSENNVDKLDALKTNKCENKMGKKMVSGSSENGMDKDLERSKIDEDIERRFKNNKKADEKVSDKKKEEMKVADPFFMTNDNSEYLTVVSSKEQAEALQNPSITSNHRNDDEELYYGSSLTGGFKQISHHERRKSSVTILSRGSDRKNGDFREFGKGGVRNGENFRNREFGSSSSHALPRRERRKLMNGGGKESKMEAEEKLHPSWEAKRRQSCPAIPQFSGKKIVFDD